MRYTSAAEIAERAVELNTECHSIAAIDYSSMTEHDGNVCTGGLTTAHLLDELRAIVQVLELASQRVPAHELATWCKCRLELGCVPEGLAKEIWAMDAAVETAARERGLM